LNGGFNFDAQVRRRTIDPEDMFYGHIGAMDGCASALLVADKMQVDAFSSAVRDEVKFPYGAEDAICNMKVIDALFKSAKSNQWEHVV
jgi:xylose isomerase